MWWNRETEPGMEYNHTRSYSINDRLIRYDELAPLEYLAQAKCLINLIDYEEIREIFGIGRKPEAQNTFQRYLRGKICKLGLPRLMYKKLLRTSHHVADQLICWIRYHDEEIFNVECEVHPMANRHLESIVWTSQGTIDYLSSANILIGRDVDDDVKFRIAYAYGLYDYMIELSHKLLKNCNYLKSTFPKHERGILQRERSSLYYWICYILSNTSEIEGVYGDEIRNYLRIEMLLFNVFALMPNYVLIKYIWTELTRTEKIGGILDLVNANVPSDLQLYLLSQLGPEDQRIVVHSRIPRIYKILVNDIYVRPFHDNLIEYIWNVMSYQDFIQIIEQLFKSIKITEDVVGNTCKDIFKDLWSSASIQLRYQALEYDYYRSFRIQVNRQYQIIDRKKSLLERVDWMNNEDIVELILQDTTSTQRRYYLKSNSCIAYAIQMIKEGKWTMLESFIKRFLPDRDDILKYKSNVLRGDDYELIKHFYEANQRISEDFYRWCFESKSRMNEFLVERREDMWNTMNDFFATKENIYKVESFLEWCLLSPSEQAHWLQKFRLDRWYKLIKLSPKISLIEVEYFLDWSFKTANKMFKSKLIIPSHTSLFTKYVCVLIKENKFKLLNDLLNWCFLYNQRNIRQFKIDFQDNCEIDDFLDVIKSIVISKNDFHTFNNFFGDWFDNESDFRTFRIKIGRPNIASWIAAEFVSMNKPDKADEFFKWCFNFNDNQMIKFKLKILVDESIRDIVVTKNKKFVKNFVEWVDPSIEQCLEFEKRFLRGVRLEEK